MGGLEQASPANAIFLFISKVKAHWRAILTLPEKLNEKRQG
jgi:hypothetical protein